MAAAAAEHEKFVLKERERQQRQAKLLDEREKTLASREATVKAEVDALKSELVGRQKQLEDATALLRNSNLELARVKSDEEMLRKRCCEAEARAHAAEQANSEAQQAALSIKQMQQAQKSRSDMVSHLLAQHLRDVVALARVSSRAEALRVALEAAKSASKDCTDSLASAAQRADTAAEELKRMGEMAAESEREVSRLERESASDKAALSALAEQLTQATQTEGMLQAKVSALEQRLVEREEQIQALQMAESQVRGALEDVRQEALKSVDATRLERERAERAEKMVGELEVLVAQLTKEMDETQGNLAKRVRAHHLPRRTLHAAASRRTPACSIPSVGQMSSHPIRGTLISFHPSTAYPNACLVLL